MRRFIMVLFALSIAAEVFADDPGDPFTGSDWTQSIGVTNDRDVIDPVHRSKLEKKWQVPGGMEHVAGWRVDKYRHVPAAPAAWIGNIQVKNSLGYFQANRGLLRSYADGTRFDEVLTNAETGKMFEHRVAVKESGRWKRFVQESDAAERPAGYTGLKVSCASCHNQAGTGEYGVGLVPGGDTVISDELPWQLVGVKVPRKPVYRWEAMGDGSEVALMLGDEQVGGYRFADRAFFKRHGPGLWDAIKSDPPITPPTAR